MFIETDARKPLTP